MALFKNVRELIAALELLDGDMEVCTTSDDGWDTLVLDELIVEEAKGKQILYIV